MTSIQKLSLRDRIHSNPFLWFLAFFCLAAALPMIYNSKAFINFFTASPCLFDECHYIDISEKGYTPGVSAFYPLWPTLLFAVKSVGMNVKPYANFISLGIFFASIPIFYRSLMILFDQRVAVITTFLFGLNPMSVFHAMAYSESIFCFLSAIFLFYFALAEQNPKFSNLLFLYLSMLLMALTRPIVLQTAASTAAAFLILIAINGWKLKTIAAKLKSGWVVISAAFLGTALYATYLKHKFGNFFQAFEAQKNWGRSLGLHWSNITHPKSVSSSDNVLTWDIQAFYLPAILVSLTLSANYWRPIFMKLGAISDPTKLDKVTGSVTFWFALFFAGCFSVIQFLSYPFFFSVGRHVFAAPFFYVGLGGALYYFCRDNRFYRYFVYAYMTFSFLYLMNFWDRFGNRSWMG